MSCGVAAQDEFTWRDFTVQFIHVLSKFHVNSHLIFWLIVRHWKAISDSHWELVKVPQQSPNSLGSTLIASSLLAVHDRGQRTQCSRTTRLPGKGPGRAGPASDCARVCAGASAEAGVWRAPRSRLLLAQSLGWSWTWNRHWNRSQSWSRGWRGIWGWGWGRNVGWHSRRNTSLDCPCDHLVEGVRPAFVPLITLWRNYLPLRPRPIYSQRNWKNRKSLMAFQFISPINSDSGKS